jgi:hypothetical protein
LRWGRSHNVASGTISTSVFAYATVACGDE